MYFKTTYDSEFDDLYMHLRSKYPQKLFDLEGIGKQLDMSQFSKNFFASNVTADASIDANANVDDVSVIAYNTELPKPFFKLNSYYILWKELKRLYGHEVANQIVEMNLTGDIYIHDFHGVGAGMPYCFNYSTYDIMTKGLPMVKKVRSLPPKYLYAFKSQLEQFTVVASNSTLGATGLADLLVVMSYYVKNILRDHSDAHFYFRDEQACWDYIKENLVSFIYTINQPMRANQSPFTNVSVYDKFFLEKLAGDYIFPDGSTPDIEIVQRLQELYLDIMNEEMRRTPLTFPVTTACFSVDKDRNIQDEEFLDMIARKNQEWGFINMYCGDSSTLSSCCFDGRQMTLSKSSDGVNYMSFEDLYNAPYNKTRRNFTIFHNGSWAQGKLIRFPARQIYKITTANNKELYVTDNHIHPTIDGNKTTDQLTTDDWLMFNGRSLDSFPEQDKGFSYEDGFLVGMYLGDGSMEMKESATIPTVHLSLNKEKYETFEKVMHNSGIDYVLHAEYNNVYPVAITSWEVHDFIREYVSGNYCYEKELNMNCLLQSQKFRQGILDGYYLTDGGNSNRIYTTSKKLAYQIECLMTSLGLCSTIDTSDRRDEEVVIRGESFKRNFVLYCVRWYSPKNKRSMKDIYRIHNNSIYFKIKNIEKIDSDGKYVYCFEMKSKDEPYFTLPNGVITHNCRLRSEQQSEYFNSFGSGSSKIGSLGVCSINLPRLAIKYPEREQFLEELKKMVEVCARVNNAKRKIVAKRIQNGNEPLYTYGFMELSKQYSTCGVCGLNECIKYLGEDITTKDGTELALKIIDTINAVNVRMQKQYDSPHNQEQVPAENMSIKIASKDHLLGYQDDYDIYSNQFIPLITNADMLERIRLQGIFDSHFSGGAIAHLNTETRVSDYKYIADLIRITAKKGVVYFAINYVLSECKDHHLSVSNGDICEVCGKPIENKYTRVVGFLTNVKNWHKVRREQDFPNRQFYNDIKIEGESA